MTVRFALLVGVALAVGGCARPAPVAPQGETDPAVAQAVIAPLLTDPDLVSLDRRFAVMSDPGPLDASIPPEDYAALTISAARAEARVRIVDASPGALAAGEGCAGCAAPLLAERASILGADCAANLNEDLEWALRLPKDLPIYPKAHLREGVGRDGVACPLRGASYTAPVPAGEVLAFYRAIAAGAGFSLRQAGRDGLVGTRGSARIAVLVRPLPGGLSYFDLLVTG